MKKYFILAAAALVMTSCGNKEKEAANNAAEELPQVRIAQVHSDVLA